MQRAVLAYALVCTHAPVDAARELAIAHRPRASDGADARAKRARR